MGVVTSRTDSDGRVASTHDPLKLCPAQTGSKSVPKAFRYIVIFRAEGTAPPSESMPSEEEMTTPMPESMVGQDIETPISTPEPATSLEFDLALPTGLNLIHIPAESKSHRRNGTNHRIGCRPL